MSTDRSWWQRQMGNQAPPTQQVQQPPPVNQYPQAPQYQQPQYPTNPQPQQQLPTNAQGQIAITDALNSNLWAGEATRTETQRCPKCHGNHYFSRAQGGYGGMPPPAPMCADCGFNGLFEQYGSRVTA